MTATQGLVARTAWGQRASSLLPRAAVSGSSVDVPLDARHRGQTVNPYSRSKRMVKQMLEKFLHGLRDEVAMQVCKSSCPMVLTEA